MKLKKVFAISLAFIITGVLSPISQYIPEYSVMTANAGDDVIDYERQTYEKNIVDKKYNITYSVNEGTLTLIKCDTNTSGQINIPSEYDGWPVAEIGEGAFKDCTKITGITMPDSVEVINSSAFENCEKLKNVSFGDRLETIGNHAFKECSSLEKIVIPDNVKKIGGGAFGNCEKLKDVSFGYGLEEIGTYAFQNCSSIEKIVIPDNVKIIDYDAFVHCVNLSSLTLGKSVELINTSAFYCCSKLKKVVIPDSVKEIGSGAFQCCGLTSVKLNEKIKKISTLSFADNEDLKSINLPSSVETIDVNAFYSCDSLESLVCGKNVSGFSISSIMGCTNMKSLTIENPKCEFILLNFMGEPVTVDTINQYVNITDKIVIKGYKNSTAETVAKKYGFKFSPLPSYGDPDADGKINSVDASYILSLYVKNTQNKAKPSSDDLECCDINKDGAVNSVDASYVLSYYVYTATSNNAVNLTDYVKKN